MERIIFGDNQFFSVNHISDAKSLDQSIRFKDDLSIIRTLEFVYEVGVNSFMCTSHERIGEIMRLLSSHPVLRQMDVFPCMPYAHKYANSITENGIYGTINKFLSGHFISSVFRGSRAIISKDYISMMELLIDTEMRLFKNVHTPIIFLQNVVTDLLLGLKMYDILVHYDQYIRKRYNARPGFITMNLPLLLQVLKEAKIKDVVISASINKSGFRMAGEEEVYSNILSTGQESFDIIAMQILAGGSINARTAIEYVSSQPGIQSIVFGASSKQHIQETVNLIKHYDNLFRKQLIKSIV